MDKLQIQIKKDKQEEAAEAPIHGDMLQAILSHVPLIDLVPSCHVSRSWNRAVFSSLRYVNKIKPWLIVHMQRTIPTHVTATHAYDPRSHVWIQIKQPSIGHAPPSSFLRSSHSTLLYMLSLSKFSFSFDPLHLAWHHVEAPRVWRNDPVVALVGHHVIVAGGVCDLEDYDPLAVEMYSLETGTWEICQSMPTILRDSAAPTWLSIAVNSRKVYVAEKYSGVTHTFDPNTKIWSGPYDLRPDENVFYSVITFVNDRLIVVGLTGVAEDVKSIKLWEVKGEWLDLEELTLKEIGEMPKALLEKLKGSGSAYMTSIGVRSMGDYVYVNNPSNSEELVLCEIGDDFECRWSGIKNVVVNDDVRIMYRLIFTCSSVAIEDLNRALVHSNWRFLVKECE